MSHHEPDLNQQSHAGAEHPGPIVLLGSGETAANVQRVYTWLFHHFEAPVRVAVLETPAGFQPNSAAVAQDVAAYIEQRLVNFAPQVTTLGARRSAGPADPASTNNPDVLEPLWHAHVLMAGPGSPTYAVRQLRDSLAWHILRARNRLGAGIMLSSATTLAASSFTLPVYELYKVGTDLHWQPGLDLFADFGLSLLLVSHWNNNDGGATLDTSRCYIGQDRFDALIDMLPPDPKRTLVGIDEKTALCLDFATGRAEVVGAGGVILRRADGEKHFAHGAHFGFDALGDFRLPADGEGLPAALWQEAQGRAAAARAESDAPPADALVPHAIATLAAARDEARTARDWASADRLRAQIEAAGWRVLDTPNGSVIARAEG